MERIVSFLAELGGWSALLASTRSRPDDCFDPGNPWALWFLPETVDRTTWLDCAWTSLALVLFTLLAPFGWLAAPFLALLYAPTAGMAARRRILRDPVLPELYVSRSGKSRDALAALHGLCFLAARRICVAAGCLQAGALLLGAFLATLGGLEMGILVSALLYVVAVRTLLYPWLAGCWLRTTRRALAADDWRGARGALAIATEGAMFALRPFAYFGLTLLLVGFFNLPGLVASLWLIARFGGRLGENRMGDARMEWIEAEVSRFEPALQRAAERLSDAGDAWSA